MSKFLAQSTLRLKKSSISLLSDPPTDPDETLADETPLDSSKDSSATNPPESTNEPESNDTDAEGESIVVKLKGRAK